MGSPDHLVNANYVNALLNRDALFDIVAKFYGIKPETVCYEIELKPEIFADTQLLGWFPDQLKATMNTRDAMGVLKCNLHQSRALGLILRDGDEADHAEMLEKLNNLETMRVKNARVLVERLQDKMGSLAKYAKSLADTREDDDLAVSMVMDEIKGKAGQLVDIIQNLEKEVDLSCDDLRRAALTLLQTVTDQVGNSQHVSIEIPTQ